MITEFREHWGEARKADFDASRLRRWLGWLRKHQFTPKGKAPSKAELI